MNEPVAWLDEIAKGALSTLEFCKQVCSLDGKQMVTDGHILVWLDKDADGLPPFPEKQAVAVRQWLKKTPVATVSRKRLLNFCDVTKYANKCSDCQGFGQRKCDECDGKGCDSCDMTGKQRCFHVLPVTDCAWIGPAVFNRRLIFKILSNVPDMDVHYLLGEPTEMMVLAGEGWKACIMPIYPEKMPEKPPRFKL